jgi:hypothetical protein
MFVIRERIGRLLPKIEEDGKSWLRRSKLYKRVSEPHKKKKKNQGKTLCSPCITKFKTELTIPVTSVPVSLFGNTCKLYTSHNIKIQVAMNAETCVEESCHHLLTDTVPTFVW